MCQYCGHDPCQPTGGKLADIHGLTAEDWTAMHWFLSQVQLPFVHRLILRAQKRAKAMDRKPALGGSRD